MAPNRLRLLTCGRMSDRVRLRAGPAAPTGAAASSVTCRVRTSSSICGAFVAHAFAAPSHRGPISSGLRGCARFQCAGGGLGGGFFSAAMGSRKREAIATSDCDHLHIGHNGWTMDGHAPDGLLPSIFQARLPGWSSRVLPRGSRCLEGRNRRKGPSAAAVVSCCDIQLCSPIQLQCPLSTTRPARG